MREYPRRRKGESSIIAGDFENPSDSVDMPVMTTLSAARCRRSPCAMLFASLLVLSGAGPPLAVGAGTSSDRGAASIEGLVSLLSFSAVPPERTFDRHAAFTIESSGPPGDLQLECRRNDGAFADCDAHVFIGDVGQEGEQTFVARIKGEATTAISHTWQVLSVYDSGSIDLLPSRQVPNRVEQGSWRGILRINCDFSHSSYDDPIVFPGEQGMAHLHRFYGNVRVDHETTMESLQTTGDSTCQGGELNRSAYWVPALLAPDYDPRTNERRLDEHGDPVWEVVPAVVGTNEEAHEVFYYSAGVDDVASIQPIPVGLRMIAGDHATQPGQEQDPSIVRWHCQSWQSSDHSNPRWSASIPACVAPDRVRMDVFFPSCWNGVDLDSEDHKRHMAYPIRDARGRAVCPSTHPVAIVRPSYHYAFGVKPAVFDPVTRSSKGWRLASDAYEVDDEAPGGLSLHADWFNGWHPTIMEAILETCILEGYDCHNGNLANDWRLSEAKEGTQEEPPIINGGLGGHHPHSPEAPTVEAPTATTTVPPPPSTSQPPPSAPATSTAPPAGVPTVTSRLALPFLWRDD